MTGESSIREMTPDEAKQRIAAGDFDEVIDVRTPGERQIAHIEGSSILDMATAQRLEETDRGTRILFYCHHGIRSRAAAEHFLAKGFTDLTNLSGGIDAWSREVDPSVPRY